MGAGGDPCLGIMGLLDNTYFGRPKDDVVAVFICGPLPLQAINVLFIGPYSVTDRIDLVGVLTYVIYRVHVITPTLPTVWADLFLLGMSSK